MIINIFYMFWISAKHSEKCDTVDNTTLFMALLISVDENRCFRAEAPHNLECTSAEQTQFPPVKFPNWERLTGGI